MLKKVVFLVFGVFIFFNGQQLFAADSCECPVLTCDSCEVQKSLEFYSEKCGDGKVNSCARPICKPKSPLPKRCMASVKKKTNKVKKSGSSVEDFDPQKYQNAKVEVGIVSGAIPGAWVENKIVKKVKKTPLEKGMKIYESDTLVTDSKGQIKIQFYNKNEMILQKDSRLKLTEYQSKENKGAKVKKKGRRALLELLKGKVRNKVKVQYNKKANYFKIKTKSAVAGVRGTDFVVSFLKGDQESTKIETLTGEVLLSDSQETKKLHIKAGNKASYVVKSNDMFDDEEIKDFVAQGFMTPVYKMSEEEIQKIHGETLFSDQKAKSIAKINYHKNRPVCEAPNAKLNQCSWHCEGNPKGAKVCHSELSQVRCVRQRCNANGNWAEETRLPASANEQCPAYGYRVDQCNY